MSVSAIVGITVAAVFAGFFLIFAIWVIFKPPQQLEKKKDDDVLITPLC
jgi:hypothetical protein